MAGCHNLKGLRDLPPHYQVFLLAASAEKSTVQTVRRAVQQQLVYCRAYCLTNLVCYMMGKQHIQQQFLQ